MTLKYSLKGTQKNSILETVLANRDINNLEQLLNPVIEQSHYSMLDNIDRAVEVFLKHCKNKSRILVVCDSDVDGYTSSAFICNYMKDLGVDARVHIHSGKQHGITQQVIDDIYNFKPSLLIMPDASSSEGDIHEMLLDGGYVEDIIVLDHHEVQGTSPAIIVNNQSSLNFENKTLSGVGVVYKFCQAVDDLLGAIGYCDRYLDLVGVGMIADVMDLRNIETRMLCKRGLSNIQNPLLKAIFEKENLEDATIIDIGFKVSPLINALIRVGSTAEKQMLFDCLLGMDYTVKYKPRGKDEVDQPLTEAVIRVGNNAKNRQRNATKKAMESIGRQIIENGIESDKVIILDISNIADRSITGLIANKVADIYKRPAILLHKASDELYTGSARSYGVENFKDICVDTNMFKLCAGHQGSFGVEITHENIEKTQSIFNTVIDIIDNELSYEVDFIIDSRDLTKQTIESISTLRHLWGNGIDEPMFLVKNIRINSKDVRKVGINTVLFSKGDVRYVKNFATSNFIDELTCRKDIGFGEANILIDMICKFKLDKYGSQIEIINYVSRIDNELIF